eukprot:gene9655-18681_t
MYTLVSSTARAEAMRRVYYYLIPEFIFDNELEEP